MKSEAVQHSSVFLFRLFDGCLCAGAGGAGGGWVGGGCVGWRNVENSSAERRGSAEVSRWCRNGFHKALQKVF